ncbi:hypothetical protein OI25_5659 [Paraburkholderia fungorum]|uniref:Uncharacterized protein n=1 Tax=Paraburkholderia fungorum TaxID=134537 RepID=A0AAP5Q7V1_9BURK|nr:hypothetical protein [Paraburkholderia fungorum]AJZ63135.1 hypothetical protein OI25_5659 [Paraburkholderia fungorum]MDT8838718.1 hypothetical protein [Paraburkholderia fungorum]PRZ48589.1 hypothetical protein BX589_12751 [Paraburkholderia fungorum]USX05453.1 hypothetical protein NHH62_04810 [Paraburkholderia fungorum]
MKSLPNEDQLQEAFVDFSMLAFELLERADKDYRYLKFSAVNAQVALELFLKFHFTKNGKLHHIQKKKNGVAQNEYIDFSQILNLYYSTRTWSFGVKRELVALLNARNSILHKARHTGAPEELAINVVKTLYFIHSTWHSDFGGLLFQRSYGLPPPISKNKMWRKGVQGFVEQLESVHDMDIRTCLACQQHSVITGEFFGLEGAEGMEYLICLNCFDSLDIEHEARLIRCHVCHSRTYIVEALNEQERQLYAGKCTACLEDNFVRRCIQCESFYHPEDGEFNKKGRYFCSLACLECGSDRF